MRLLSAYFSLLLLSALAFSQQSDAALRNVIEKDRSSRGVDGKIVTLSAAEHVARGQVYHENRVFPVAREHFQKIFDFYPADAAMSTALFLTGRSYYWEREYAKAIPFLDRAAREYPTTKDGREGLSFKGACHVRLGKNDEAAQIYEQYTIRYPDGERVDSAYLNIIDALREAGDYASANSWVEKVRVRFPGSPTEASALHARLRMQIYRSQWEDAVGTATLMQEQVTFGGSMASADEVKYLRAFALEKQGKKAEARLGYASIPEKINSYFGGLATDKTERPQGSLSAVAVKDFPTPYSAELLFYSKKHKLDPRFVLAIMKQESGFRPGVKSPSAARGLLQLVYDTAVKYNKRAGFANFVADDLYQPKVNIAIGTEYLADLRKQFGGLNEAIAASYNGGEDNAARWLNRTKPKEPAIFASEIGFSETKNYVFKVMANYRVYRALYDENLVKR